MGWIGLAARAAGTSNRRHQSSKLLWHGHFNLRCRFPRTPRRMFAQFAEAPTSLTMATATHLPAR